MLFQMVIKIDSNHSMVIEIDFGHLETCLRIKMVIKICVVAINLDYAIEGD
jgi:hypothetical protein